MIDTVLHRAQASLVHGWSDAGSAHQEEQTLSQVGRAAPGRTAPMQRRAVRRSRPAQIVERCRSSEGLDLGSKCVPNYIIPCADLDNLSQHGQSCSCEAKASIPLTENAGLGPARLHAKHRRCKAYLRDGCHSSSVHGTSQQRQKHEGTSNINATPDIRQLTRLGGWMKDSICLSDWCRHKMLQGSGLLQRERLLVL